MSTPVLITARSFNADPRLPERLVASGCHILPYAYGDRPSEEELASVIGEAVAVISGNQPFTARVFSAAPRLRIISRTGVGVDTIDLPAATAAGVVVTNTPAANSAAVADLTLGLMLAAARWIPSNHAGVAAGQWPRRVGVEVCGKVLGLVGLGRIGRGVARRAHGFDMTVLAYDPYVRQAAAAELGVEMVKLDDLLARSDFVSLHTPSTPETKRIVDARALGLMKPTAILINAARGALVDEAALAEALREGRLAGAAIDAFQKEPPTGSPLLGLDNVVLSPHAGAITAEAVVRMGEEAIDNLLAVLMGRRPESVVNPEVYQHGPRSGE